MPGIGMCVSLWKGIAMSQNWYGEALCKIHFDMHTPHTVERVGEEFDAPAFADSLVRAGAEAVCFFSRCAYGWSYYPTKIGSRHPNCRRDLLGEATEACKARGIRVLAYMAIDVMVAEAAAAHPEWRCRNMDGTFYVVESPVAQRHIMCICGAFTDEYLLPLIEEIGRAYPVDGFFLDGMYQAYWNPCCCDSCAKEYGHPVPDGPDHPDVGAFRLHKLDMLWKFHEKATRTAQSVRPELILATNWHGRAGWAKSPWPGSTCLTGDDSVTINHSLAAARQLDAWAWRGIPCDVMTARMLWWWQDWTTRPAATLKTEAATSIAHGGKLFVGDLLEPVTAMPNPGVMDVIKSTFTFARERAALASDAEPLADVAILLSNEVFRSRPELRETPGDAMCGSYLALTEGGWTTHILHEDDLPDRLARYKTLVVPEQPALGQGVAHAVRDFVAGGGSLVVTGETPLDDAGDKFVLGEVLGLEPAGETGWDRAFVDPDDLKLEGFPPAWEENRAIVPVMQEPVACRISGARALAALISPGPEYQIGARPPGERSEYPAVTVNSLGNGKAVYASMALATDFWKRGNSGAKHLLNALVTHVTPEPTVEVDAPANLDVTLAEQPGKFLVHLVAYTPERRHEKPPVVERTPPVGPVTVRVRAAGKPVSVKLEPGGEDLDFEWDDGVVTTRLERIKIHGCVVLHF